MVEYLFILANAAALNMLACGVIMLRSRRNGGVHFFRFGRFGGSFYVARNRN